MNKTILLAATLLTATMSRAAVYNVSPDCSTISIDEHEFTIGPDTYLLSSDCTPSAYVFNNAKKAFDAINTSGRDNITLFIAPAVYWLDDPDDPAVRRNPDNTGKVPFASEVTCDTLSVIGLTDNPEDIVLAVNRGQTQGALGNYTMLHFTGRCLQVENLTMGNYCNVDLVYPRDPSHNRPRRKDAIVQAQVGICTGTDRLFARNCRFISRLNLCPLIGARRSLYKNCYFECTDDALSGSAIYLDCRFTFYSSKPFYSTASTGAVFLNCDIHSLVNGVQYLTKAPGMVTMIDTRFTSDNPITLRWTRDISPVRCYQSGVTLNGKPVTIDADRPQLGVDISTSPLLLAYKITYGTETVYNTPNLLSGDDGWDPLGIRPTILKAEQESGQQLSSWPVTIRLNPSAIMLAPQGDTLTVSASPRLWGDYPTSTPTIGNLSWTAPTTITLLSAGNEAVAVTANTFPKEIETTISAFSSTGLTGATSVTVAPFLKPAPTFISRPAIKAAKSTLKLDYMLPESGSDNSYIVWYRSSRADHSDTTAVRHGYGSSAQSYPLSPADKGYYISASVTPSLSDTQSGECCTVHFDKQITSSMISLIPKKENTLSTSFAEIPIRNSENGRRGFWNFDTYKPADTRGHSWTPDTSKSWYYGHGVDAATGIGLVQATRGARLSYTPSRTECRTMSVSLIAEPSKGPGQGFGSATGQYMDICVKFNPITLSGYALRIERTPDYDKAVTFTLVRYTDGIATPICEPIASNCFRTPCSISIDINDNNMTATAKTDAPTTEASNPDIKPYVLLTSPVESTRDCSLMIQHTGSVGASATLLRNLNISWK